MKYEELIFALKRQYPKFEIKRKRGSKLLVLISWFLFLITFGKMKRETFLDSFVTTIGYKIYVHDGWADMKDRDKMPTLLHEGVHIRQYHEEGIWYAIKYLLFSFPVLWAHCRVDYEIEALAAEIVYDHIEKGAFLYGSKFDRAIRLLTGPEYFWPTLNRGMVRRKLRYMIVQKLKKFHERKI